MSVKVKSRYDKYIPLFGKANDKRVRLFIHELEEQALENNKGPLTQSDVKFTKATSRMENRVFTFKDTFPGANDNTVHSEWKLFMNQLTARLAGKGVNSEGLKVVRELKNAGNEPRSTKQVVWLLLLNLADLRSTSGASITLSEQADSVETVVFKSQADMLNAMTPNGLFFEDNSNAGALLANSIGMNVNTLTAMSSTDGNAAKALFLQYASNPTLRSQLESTPADTVACSAIIRNWVDNDVATYFNVKVDEFFVSLMLDEAVSKPIEEEGSTAFFEDVPSDEERYFRNAEGQLMERDYNNPNGRPVFKGSQAWEDLKKDGMKSCLSTGVAQVSSTNTALTCAAYLQDCLAGSSDGLSKCKNYMRDHGFWESAKKEAASILPAMILKTLEAFGFAVEMYKHEVTKQHLKKIQSVRSWLVSLNNLAKDPSKSGLNNDDVESISNNVKLTGYLEMLVTRVNNNPTILNAGYNGPLSKVGNNDYFNGSKLSTFGLAAHQPSSFNLISNMERTNLTVGNALGMQMRSVGLPLGIPFGVPVVMTGGSYFNPIESLENRMKFPVKQSWSIMERQYDGLVERLKRNNKSISSKDNSTIREYINKLRDAEVKLTKTMLYAEKYAKLIEVFDQQDGRSSLSLDHLQKFVDARDGYFKKVRERQNSLVSIIRTVAEAVTKEVKEESGNANEMLKLNANSFQL